LIDLAAAHPQINMAVDTYSLEPVQKFDLLKAMRPLGLTWKIEGEVNETSRDQYWSRLHNAERLGYLPTRRCVDIVVDVVTRLARPS
jgi:hypothetical protein